MTLQDDISKGIEELNASTQELSDASVRLSHTVEKEAQGLNEDFTVIDSELNKLLKGWTEENDFIEAAESAS